MSSDVFARFAPFITEYIYRHGWEGLRPVQTEAAHVIFDTDNNLLLSPRVRRPERPRRRFSR